MVRTTSFIGTLSILSFLLGSCYLNVNKHIDVETRVRINDHLPISIINEGNSTFNEYLNESQYKEEFLLGLNAELRATTNIIIDETKPEFEIQFELFMLTESTKLDTVENVNSPDHGKVFELTTMTLVSKGTLVRLSDGVTFNWSADKSKSESFTSMRSLEEIATGANKEKNLYHEDNFTSGTTAGLTQKIGQRSGVVIVKEIYRSLK